jgi:hypothetical protein
VPAQTPETGDVRLQGETVMLNTYANDNSEGAAFVIETAEIAAGIVVRQPEGYRFFAANERFTLLDGSIFKSPRAAQKAADLMHKAAARDHRTERRFGGDSHDRNGRRASPPNQARA